MTNNFNSSHPTVLSLHGFRQGLIALKDDRTTYIRSANVRNAYQKLCEFILADDSFANNEEDSSTETTSEQKEYHQLLDDCFLLISLLFLTFGGNYEPPACYAPCRVIKRLLQHLAESDNFSANDLSTLHKSLKHFDEIINRNMSTHNLRIIGILATKVKECQEMLKPLQAKLDQIAPELLCLHEKLVSLRRCIKGAEAKNKFSPSAVEGYLEKIQQIDTTRIDGKFIGDDGTTPERGQDQVELILSRCYSMADEAMQRQGTMSPDLLDAAQDLLKMKGKLERLELTQAWSLREADLYDFLVKLMEIDDQRVEGQFVGRGPRDGCTKGQCILLYLLRRSYAHVYTLINSSEPVSEALAPIFNQLQTVRSCLIEVQKFGLQDARELYPYSMKLTSIDNMRVDGKFMIGNDIPEGQGRVASLLAECFELCQEIRIQETCLDDD